MHKPFSELRNKMSQKAVQLAEEKTKTMLEKIELTPEYKLSLVVIPICETYRDKDSQN